MLSDRVGKELRSSRMARRREEGDDEGWTGKQTCCLFIRGYSGISNECLAVFFLFDELSFHLHVVWNNVEEQNS